MSDDDDFALVRGSGNLFRDFGHANPGLEQLRSILAARIIQTLDADKITARKAHELTGIAAADFSRIRRANLGRFTVDRPMTILARLVLFPILSRLPFLVLVASCTQVDPSHSATTHSENQPV